MNEEMKEKLRRIVKLSKREVGDSEESVKINCVVPVLECFGHERLDFEYKHQDIVIKKDLPRFCKVIVETKRYDKNLDRELKQLHRYCNEERPLLGIIANGHEMRVFSPSWRFRPAFPDTLIYRISRKSLKDDNIIRLLEKILTRDNLESGSARESVIEREHEIASAEQEKEKVEEGFKEEEDGLKAKIEELSQKVQETKMQIKDLETQIRAARSRRDARIGELWDKLDLPVASIPPSPPTEPAMPSVGELPRAGQTVYIELPRPRSGNGQLAWRQHNLIPVRKKDRPFFPGYKIPFSVDTDIGELKMYVTAAPKGTQTGDPVMGSYLKGDTILWLRHHAELKPGYRLKFTVVEPHQKYHLETV